MIIMINMTFCLFHNPYIYIFDDLHNIFVMTYCAYISMIDTLIHVGRIKMLHKHTHLPLCVLTACGHWTIDIETELSLIYRPRSTFIYWGLVTPNMVTKYGDKILVIIWFREWLVISLVPAISWTNADVLSIGTLEINLC